MVIQAGLKLRAPSGNVIEIVDMIRPRLWSWQCGDKKGCSYEWALVLCDEVTAG